MIARIVRAEDFERVLRTRTKAHSVHFAVHHLPDRPGVPRKRGKAPVSGELSTDHIAVHPGAVDDSRVERPGAAPAALWLGAVVPKRHARRAVTRTLLKRQIRVAVCGHAEQLAAGLWVVRLRAPFERARVVSAASDVLRRAVRAELELLMSSAAQCVVVP